MSIVDKFLQSDKFKALSPDEQQVKLNEVVLNRIATLPKFADMEEASRITKIEEIRQELHSRVGEGLYGSVEGFEEAAVLSSRKKAEQGVAKAQPITAPKSPELIKQQEGDGLEIPWVDPVTAAAGGFGGSLGLQGAKLGYKALATSAHALTRALASAGTAAVMDYPVGIATETVAKDHPELAFPVNIALGLASGAFIESRAEKAIMRALAKSGALPAEAGKLIRPMTSDPSIRPLNPKETAAVEHLIAEPNLAPELKAAVLEKVDPVNLPQSYFNNKLLKEVTPKWQIPEHTQITIKGEYADPVLHAKPIIQDNEDFFRSWDKSDKQITGFRSDSGGLGPQAGTEGYGSYIAKDSELASFFGESKKVSFEKPNNPLIVNEEPLYFLHALEEPWSPIKKGDSLWTKLHKEAVIKSGEPFDTTNIEKVQQSFTELLIEKGYDSVKVKSDGQEWVVILDKKSVSSIEPTSVKKINTVAEAAEKELPANIWQRETYSSRTKAIEAKKVFRAEDGVPKLKAVKAEDGKGWKLVEQEAKVKAKVKAAKVSVESVKLDDEPVAKVKLDAPVEPFSAPHKEIIQGRYTKKLNALHDVYAEASSAFNRPDNPLGPLEKFDQFLEDIRFGMDDLMERKLIDQEEADKLLDGLTPNFLKGFMGSPTKEMMHKALSGLEISGLNHLEKATKNLSGQAGFIDVGLMREMGLQGVSAMTGFGFDEDGDVNWSMDNWVRHGGPIISGLAIGRHAYRNVKAAGGIRAVGSRVSERIWKALDQVPAAKYLAESFHPTERTAKATWALKQEFKRSKNMIRHQIDDMAAGLVKNFNPEERALISDVIEKEGNWQNASDRIRAKAEEVIAWNKNINTMLKEAGISSETIDKLGEKYLHRYYAVKASSRPYVAMKAKMKSIGGNYLKARGQVRKIAEDGLRSMGIDPTTIKQGDEFLSFTGGGLNKRTYVKANNQSHINRLITSGSNLEPYKWELDDVTGGVHKFRRDFTKAEREAMGEVRDVAVRMAVLAREVSHDLALGHMFKNIKANDNWTIQTDGKTTKEVKELAKKLGWQFVPEVETSAGVKKFGALGNNFVHPDVAKVLKSLSSDRIAFSSPELTHFVQGLDTINRAILAPWKIGKTALSPATHGVNIITNLHLSLMAGYNPVKLMVDGGRELASKGQYFTEAIQAGLLDSSIMKAEWDLDSFVKLANQIDVSKVGDHSTTGKAMSAFGKLMSPLSGAVKGAMRSYENEDKIFKLGVFIAERNKGMSAAEALNTANKWFLDYTDVPRGINLLRRTGAVPFISWGYKVIPAILNTAIDHPERLIGLVMGYKLLGDYHYEKEYHGRAEAQRNYESALMEGTRDENKTFYGAGPSAMVRLGNNEKGQAKFWDASRYLPGGDLMTDMFKGFPFGFHPLIATVTALTMNQNPSFKTKIKPYDKPETPEQEDANTKGLVTFMVQQWLPNLPVVPGSFSFDKVGNALVAEGVISKDQGERFGWTGKDYLGNEPSLRDAMLSQVGVKIKTLDQEGTHALREGQRVKAIKDGVGGLIKETLSETSTEEDKTNARSNLDNVITSRTEKMDRLDRLKKLTK